MKKPLYSVVWLVLILGGNPEIVQGEVIAGDTTTAFQFSGNLYTGTYFYGANGIEPHRSPFSAYIGGDFNLTYKSISLPFSFIFSEQERSFQQPFNQFGISPSYKWITLHAGYRNINWSTYTLGGHTFLGGGIEINPGLFRFGAVYGKFTRATRIDTVDNFISEPAFERKGYAVRIGVGSNTNYVDIITLYAADDPHSMSYDSTDFQFTPAQNLVTGIATKQKIGKRFFFDMEGALSMYTDDAYMQDAVYDQSKDFQNLQDITGRFIVINSSTQLHSALLSTLGYTGKYFSAKLAYRRVGPEYNSMGTYYLMNDLQQITLQPSFVAWKRKITGSGSIGLQNDNLNGMKSATSRQVIGSGTLQINPQPHYGVSIAYSNYSTGQKAALMELNDTVRVALVSQNFSIVPRYTLRTEKLVHTAVLVYSLQTLQDKNPFTTELTSYHTNNMNITYAVSYLPWFAGATLSYNHNRVNGAMETSFSGVNIGVNKSLLKNTCNISAGILLNATAVNGESSGGLRNVTGSISYQLKKDHRFALNVTQIHFNSSIGTIPSYSEVTANISYTFIF